MKAAIIGASAEALHAIKKAQEHGIFVTALDGNPEADGLKAADRTLVVDISDEEAVIEALRGEKPDFVLTVPVGRYLTTIGAANDALGLPGITKEMAVLCTDKYLFHEKLHRAGLRNCRCYATGREAFAEAAKRQGQSEGADGKADETNAVRTENPLAFPAILKPRYGSGSRGIHLLSGKEELEAALEEIGDEDYVLEECVAGEEYGADGCITKQGFQLILLRRKENTPPPARQAVGYYSVLPGDAFREQAEEYLRKVTACLGLRECLFHADIIRGEAGPFVIELSARPSGHNLHNLFTPLCTGVDMVEEYIKYRMGKPYDFAPVYTKSMLIHYFDMSGRMKQVPDREQAAQAAGVPVIAWQCHIEKGEVLQPVSDGHSLMGRGFFVLESEDVTALSSGAEAIKERFF